MLLNKDNRFNLANLITFGNIACGVIAIHFIVHGDYLTAIILAWIAGALDILDGKVARHFKLSTEFGVQLDSYAAFYLFCRLCHHFYYTTQLQENGLELTRAILGVVFLIYIISGLRRLIELISKVEVGEAEKYFTGVPTLLVQYYFWVLY